MQRHNQTFGIPVGQRSKEDRVDNGENRRRGPDPKREREDGEEREAGLSHEHPAGKAKISNERVHVHGWTERESPGWPAVTRRSARDVGETSGAPCRRSTPEPNTG